MRIYTQHDSKLGRQDASKSRESAIVNRFIFLILTDLRSAIRGNFHASWRPSFESRWVYLLTLLLSSVCAVEIAIQGVHLEVEIAATHEARSKGLSGRKTLSEGTGMLFTYDKPEVCRFWMKDTLVPLSIAFFDEEKRLIEWKDMPPPGEPKLTLVSSSKPALFALEVPLGWFASHKIQPGARFSFIPK